MEEKDRALLKEVLELSKENNRMVKRLYSSYWWGRVWRIAYWTIIIGLTLTGYYIAQPYIDQIKGLYQGIDSQVQNATQAVQSALGVSNTVSE